MIRTEFILVGCVFIVLGLLLAGIGYDKIQPSMLEQLVTFTEQLSGQPAPDDLHPSKTPGYVLLVLGGTSLFAGIEFILRSRSTKK